MLQPRQRLKLARDARGLAIASPDKGIADRAATVSVKIPLRPVSGADGVERVDDRPLMATGLDLKGPPIFSERDARKFRNTSILTSPSVCPAFHSEKARVFHSAVAHGPKASLGASCLLSSLTKLTKSTHRVTR